MRGNNLKSLASNFQVAIRFHPHHLQPKTLANSFSILIQQLLTKKGPLFVGFLRHKYIFWLFKDMLIIRDRAPLNKQVLRITEMITKDNLS